MIRNRKRLWALLLSAALIVTQLPVAVAMAENNAPENGSIASFAELPSGVTEQTVEIGTELSALNLPDTVTATIYHVTEDTVIPEDDNIEDDSGDTSTATPSDAEGSVSGNDEGESPIKDSGKTVTTVTTSEKEIPVTWDGAPNYDGETEGKYVFTADVGGYVLSGSAKLPEITVTVAAGTAENPPENPTGEPLPCTKTGDCTLEDGHEGECVTELPPVSNGLAKNVTGWSFVVTEYSDYIGKEFALPGVSMEWQADFDTVVSMLPTGISAEIEGETDPVTVDITGWACPEYVQDDNDNWPLTGDYTFTAKLPEGYACEPLPTVKVLLGGAVLYAGGTGDFTVDGGSSPDDYSYANNTLTINSSEKLTISGNTSTDKILVPANVTANLTLADVTISVGGQSGVCAFEVAANGTANIILAPNTTNTLTSGYNRAGLQVPSGATLTIDGSGTLKVTGGTDAAGIGGGYKASGGNITIKNGNIEANSSYGGAGIGGGGSGGSGGNITIENGTIKAIARQGAGIGGGSSNGSGGNGGNIIIKGGNIEAESNSGAGIGGGYGNKSGGSGGTVQISGENTKVIARGSSREFDVGGGASNSNSGVVGSGGSLSVTDGATLEMKKGGTNAANPTYRNCTIIDKDGNSFNYNGSGEIVPILSLEADPADSATVLNNITLTVTLSGAFPRSSGQNIKFIANGQTYIETTDDTGKASCTVGNLAPGTYIFSASFEADAYNVASATEITGYTVNLGTQEALGITGLDNAYTYGCNEFSMSTSGGSGSGTVSYTSSDPNIASVEGGTVTIHKAGTFTVTATKAADSHYAEAKVTSHAVTVRSATPNMSLTASGGSTTSDPLTLTATVSKVGKGVTPAGTVTFKVGDKILHSDSLDGDGSVVHTISNPEAGNHVYTVEYSGQTGYYNKTSTARTIGVGLTDQTGFAITNPGEKTYGDGNFTLATIGGQSTGSVSYAVPNDNGVLTVAADGSVKIIGTGKVTVTATKAGDNKYNQATATQEITVQSRDIDNVTVNVTGDCVYTGSQLQPIFEVKDGGIAINTGDYTNSYGTNEAAGIGAGSITLTGQRNYTGTKTVKFDIKQRPLDSAVIILESTSYTYTGSEIKPAVTGVTVDGITVLAAEYDVGYADNKEVGTATVTITAKADANFIGSASTKFTIAQANTPSGGGNSSNGSSVTTQTPQPTADDPNPPTVGKITPSVTVDKDGKVIVSVSDRDIQNAIDKATAQAKKDGTLANGIAVSIDLTGLKTQFNTLPLTLSRTVYQKLVDAGVEHMSIVTPQISLSLDLETLKTIYTNATGNVTINAVRAENSKLPTGMQNRPAYDLTIVSGGKQISDFGNGNIAVTLPYALQGTEQGGNLQMAYVDTEGKVQNMTNSSYHANQSAMIGRTNHFTVFGIIQKPAPAFKDIEGHWAKDDILFVASRELLAGTGKKLFSPDTGMTRGMFVTALGRLAGIDQTQYKNTKFSDVAATAYYAPYVAWATEKGIVNGTTDTTFAPDTNISREQMAVIMQNYAKTMGYTVPKTREAVTFADGSSIESWAKDAVKAMQMAGVMNGRDGNRFDPKASATRAEVSAVLRRFVEIVIDPATASGWEKNDSGHWLYYKDGKALTGWQTIGKLRYYFNGDGVMHEGWKQDTSNSKWYYWTNAGAATGWKKIGTKLYYFDENGVMAVNTRIDGYEIGPDGARK